MDIKSTNKLRISLGKFNAFDFSVAFYIFAMIFADGTRVLDVSVVILVAIGILRIGYSGKIKVNAFIILMALFILFNAIMVFVGAIEYPSASAKRLTTVVFNFIVNYLLFTYFIDQNSRDKAEKYLIFFSACLVVYILISNGGSLLKGRFGSGTPYIFGLRGTNGRRMNTNFICRIFYTAFCFSMYQSWHLRENIEVDFTSACNENILIKTSKRYKWLAIIFGAVSVLTGSRAGIIVVSLFLLLSLTLRANSFEKRFKYIVVSVGIIAVGYLLIMYVPKLYDIVGRRFDVLINGLFSDDGYVTRSSAFYRNRMKDYGMKWFSQRPIWGWGLDSFTQLSPYDTYSHNNFVELLVSSGIVGFAIYYGAILFLGISAWKVIRRKEEDRLEAVVCLAFLIAIVFMNVSHVDYVYRDALLFLYLMAAAVSNWKTNYKGGIVT